MENIVSEKTCFHFYYLPAVSSLSKQLRSMFLQKGFETNVSNLGRLFVLMEFMALVPSSGVPSFAYTD